MTLHYGIEQSMSSAKVLNYVMLMSMVTIVLMIIADKFNYEFCSYHFYLKITSKKHITYSRGGAGDTHPLHQENQQLHIYIYIYLWIYEFIYSWIKQWININLWI